MDLVRSEFGLVNMGILWSGSLFVPAIIIHAITRQSDRDAREIAGWMALAALHHRYSGASETALEQDVKACRASDPIGALLKNLRHTRESLYAAEKDFSGFLNDRSALFAVYVACKASGAKDLFSKQKILLQGGIDRHHLVPRAHFSREERSRADTLANIAFIAGDTNRVLGASSLDSYLKKIPASILASQCIPLDRALWDPAHVDEFWHQRRELLAKAFNNFLDEVLTNRRLGHR
jgi:hypothetical protein